ncbi:hypothetical protein BBJ28_00018275 [Nothophytophthora sp. Chile5]|nr:hypothetical protein BBJ28_00018275 [Nothophytophthora sp. Chile5]
MSKPFDVVVFGATGFTGPLVARHLATEPESALGSSTAIKWALAGRSADKLARVKQQLKEKLPQVDGALIDAIPVVVADSRDEASLLAMVRQTKVVMSLVGPYGLNGELLIKVCAENGVHYCDLTGEMLWVHEMVRKYQEVAVSTGAMLVNSCGVDSAPSDLVAYLIAARLRKTRGKHVKTGKVDFLITDFAGSVSGGTIASVFQMVDNKTSEQLAETCNPYVLTDSETLKQKQLAGLVEANAVNAAVSFDKTSGRWTSLFLGQLMNHAVVHRSNFLLNGLYGRHFVYGERFAKGGLLMQHLITAGSVAIAALMYCNWTRRLLQKLVPGSGEGPSETTMRNGCFVVEAAGYTEDGELAVKLKAAAEGDPGYRMTVRLVSECAICLAKRELREEEEGIPTVTGGFNTPACAFGSKLADRLHAKKFLSFELEDVASKQFGQGEKEVANAL